MPHDQPGWVEPLCRIAVVWRGSGKSIFQSFEEAAPDLSDLSRLRSLVADYLVTHPELIEAWQDYSRDKRTASGHWLDRTKVGYFDGQYNQDVRRYHDRAKACADFIRREAVANLEDHDTTGGDAAYERGSIYLGRRQYQRGYQRFAAAAQLYAASFGGSDERVVAALAGQASCLLGMGEYDRAAAVYQEALDAKRRSRDVAKPTADELAEALRLAKERTVTTQQSAPR